MAKGDIEISIDANASGAIKGFKQTETAAQRASRSIHAGAKIAAVGFAAVGVGALALARGAAEDQQAATALATQLKNTTGATKAQVSAVEDWITKQGQLTGITDDQLRPALAKLVTSTGSIAKAQKLASLAQDVAIGTGKDYNAVVEALQKGANGSVGGLSRLGIATKDAAGKTKSFAAIQQELADKFKGQATKQAETLGGRMQILRTQLSEAGESIGYVLIPALTTLANFAVQKVLPAMQAVGKWFSDNKPLAIALGIAVGAFAAAFIVASVALKIYSAGATIVSAVTKTWTGIQWALNASVLGFPLVWIIAAIAAVIVAAILIAKNWDKVKAALTATWDAIKVAFAKSWDAIKAAGAAVIGFFKSKWPLLLAILTGPIGVAVLVIAKHWGTIKSGAGAVVDWVRNKFSSLMDFFRGLPGKIGHIFSGLWSGLAGGLKDAINSVLHLPLKIPSIDTHIPGVGKVGGQTLIPALAKGGIVSRPTLALIGDNIGHREAVVPLTGPDAHQLGGGGLTIENLTIHAAPNEPIDSSLPRAIGMLDLLYGAA